MPIRFGSYGDKIWFFRPEDMAAFRIGVNRRSGNMKKVLFSVTGETWLSVYAASPGQHVSKDAVSADGTRPALPSLPRRSFRQAQSPSTWHAYIL